MTIANRANSIPGGAAPPAPLAPAEPPVTAIAVAEQFQLPTASEAESRLAAINDLGLAIKAMLVERVDYDPRTGALYKSGMEKIWALNNLRPNFRREERTNENFVFFDTDCDLHRIDDGLLVSTGGGSCNSTERKHWKADPWANHNTIKKMADKRAGMAATLFLYRLSGCFNQDIDDYQPHQLGVVEGDGTVVDDEPARPDEEVRFVAWLEATHQMSEGRFCRLMGADTLAEVLGRYDGNLRSVMQAFNEALKAAAEFEAETAAQAEAPPAEAEEGVVEAQGAVVEESDAEDDLDDLPF